jgi:1-acyl-sn-glycerol-3-phosphate acyltransferase
MSLVRSLYKPILLILLLFLGLLLALLILRNIMPTQGFGSRLTRLWHQAIISTLGIKLKIIGNRENANVLFVPNHLSWLDISILGALVPVHFLSKAEITGWPFIGMLATRAGTLYINRGGRNAAEEANKVMQQILEKNHNVVLFAEGTTTDGDLRKFHGRLMQSAIDAKSIVQPVAIFYPDETGKINRKILYTGNMHFISSAFTIFSLKKIPVEVHFLPPVQANGKTRGELASYCFDSVANVINNK